MWTEDSEPADVGARVYPRYLGIASRLWGGGRQGQRPDLSVREAAELHCKEGGSLEAAFGFTCGRFQKAVGLRSDAWTGAKVWSNFAAYDANAYPKEDALNGDKDVYFWAMAPRAGQSY